MTPEEHLAQAAEYMERAEKSVLRHPGKSSSELPFVGEDVILERHVNVYTRLATMHMQMASTKALMHSMPSGGTISPYANKSDNVPALIPQYLCDAPEAATRKQWEQIYGTMTGRMGYAGHPVVHDAPEVSYCAEYGPDEKFCGHELDENGECPDKSFHVKMESDAQVQTHCTEYIRRNGALRLCDNLLKEDNTCPAANWHDTPSEGKTSEPPEGFDLRTGRL